MRLGHCPADFGSPFVARRVARAFSQLGRVSSGSSQVWVYCTRQFSRLGSFGVIRRTYSRVCTRVCVCSVSFHVTP